MIRYYYWGTGLFLIAGLSLGFFIIPSDEEIAFMFFKSKHYNEAYSKYEQKISDGNFKQIVVGPLSDIYVKYIETDKAISILKKYIAIHPADIGALSKLAFYYKISQDRNLYLDKLETLNQLDPKPDRIRALISETKFQEKFNKQLYYFKALNDLDTLRAGELLSLAYLLIDTQQADEALNVLQPFFSQPQKHVPLEMLKLYVGLLVNKQQYQEALDTSMVFLPKTAASKEKLVYNTFEISKIFLLNNQPVSASSLIDLYKDHRFFLPFSLKIETEINIEIKHFNEAFQRLSFFYEKGQLPDSLYDDFVQIVCHLEDISSATKLAKNFNLDLLSEKTVQLYLNVFYNKIELTLFQRLREEIIGKIPDLDV